MKRRFVIGTAIGAALLAVGVGLSTQASGTTAGPGGATVKAKSFVVMSDHVDIDSASTLASLSEYVVGGNFTTVVGSGLASTYGFGAPGPDEPRVQLWNFHVDRVFKGSATTDVLVTRYDPASVSSEMTPVSKGMRAVVFLTAEREGARAVVGGDQGLLLRSSTGALAPISGGTTALTGASTEDALTVALGK